MRLIFFLVSTVLAHALCAQSFESLKTYPFNIDQDNPSGLSWLKNDLETYNYICTSEFHRTELAIEQYRQFLLFLMDNGGVDKLVMERPFTYGLWLTKYLNTGDEFYLKMTTERFWSFDKFRKKDKIAHDSFELFQWLYHTLKEKDLSITVVGIDLDENRHGSLELWSLMHLIEKHEMASLFPNSIQQLELLVSKEDENSIGTLKKWMANFEKEYSPQKALIQQKMNGETVFENTVQSLKDVVVYGNGNSQSARDYRESVMLRNFKREVNPTDRIYAQFGAGHIANDKLSNGYTGFMSMLQKDPIYANRTLAITIHCINCRVSKNTDANIPYRLEEEGSGYYTNDGAYFLPDNDTRHLLFKHLGHQSTAIDLRSATGNMDDLDQIFQWMIILF